jgi:hypothetical protein
MVTETPRRTGTQARCTALRRAALRWRPVAHRRARSRIAPSGGRRECIAGEDKCDAASSSLAWSPARPGDWCAYSPRARALLRQKTRPAMPAKRPATSCLGRWRAPCGGARRSSAGTCSRRSRTPTRSPASSQVRLLSRGADLRAGGCTWLPAARSQRPAPHACVGAPHACAAPTHPATPPPPRSRGDIGRVAAVRPARLPAPPRRRVLGAAALPLRPSLHLLHPGLRRPRARGRHGHVELGVQCFPGLHE